MNKRLISIFCAILMLAGCATKQPPTPAEVFEGQSAEQIFNAGEQALVKKDYDKAIKNFEGLDALYPFSQYEEQAQLNLIYAYYKASEFAQSAAAATRFIRLYPRSPNVDYAYYMKGMANFSQDRGVLQRYVETDLSQRELGTAKQAFADFADFLRRYPRSQYAPDARHRMIYLRNLMAQQELNTAEFYYKREAYVAAANRANFIINHYQQSPQVVPALGIMVDAYQALDLQELSEQSLRILHYNYPDSEVYQHIVAERR